MIKTEKQQIFHAKMLSDIRDILEKNNITAILTGSALLGARREGDLLAHCPGVVLSTFYDQIKPKENSVISDLKNAGFKIEKHFINRNYKIRVSKKGLNAEICGYSEAKKYYYRKIQNKTKIIPKKLLSPPWGSIELRGKLYKTPHNIEKYLRYTYKNWKVKMTGTPSSYKTNKHMRIK